MVGWVVCQQGWRGCRASVLAWVVYLRGWRANLGDVVDMLAWVTWQRGWPWHIYDEVFCSEPYSDIIFIDSWCIKHIQNSRLSRYCESLKYSLHRTVFNLSIFTTYVYSSASTLRTRVIWWTVFYRTRCDDPMMHIQNSRYIQNPVKYLFWRILFRIMCDPSIFKTLAYSESKAYS